MDQITKHEIEVAGKGYQVVAIRDQQFDALIQRLSAIEEMLSELKVQLSH